MSPNLKQKIEQFIGTIADVFILDEQGCTSEVKCIVTEKGSYILKSATQEKYRSWQ